MIRTQCIAFFSNKGERISEWYVHRNHSFSVYENGGHEAYSMLLVCPKCQNQWAMLLFCDNHGELTWPVPAFCEHCNIKDDWHPVPGSILIEHGWGVIDDSLLAVMPLDLLQREFTLHLKAYSP